MYVVKQDPGNSYNQASLKNWILNSGSQSLTAPWDHLGHLFIYLGTSQPTVHGVAKNGTQLSNFTLALLGLSCSMWDPVP